MKVYLLFVGGSGIRVAKSFLHLCGAGCFPGHEFKIMLIDSDNSNGDTDLLKTIIKKYNAIGKLSDAPDIDFYKDQNDDIVVWNPLKENASDSMEDIIKRSLWTTDEDKNIADLYDFLYTKEEQSISLEEGFYGHTSIGSYFMTNAISGDKLGMLNKEWTSFFTDIKRDDAVFVIGSMFGGTGASALPTIAKILKDYPDTKDNYLGAGIIMPYYSTAADNDNVGDINSKLFPAKNKASLGFYSDQKLDEKFEHIYFIGDEGDNFMILKNARGGKKQRNKAHHVEIMAAATIIDFINDINFKKRNLTKAYDSDVKTGNKFVSILNRTGDKVATKLISFLELAILFNKAIYKNIKENKGAGWLGKVKFEGYEKNFAAFSEYCKEYINWMFEILNDTNNDGKYYNPQETIDLILNNKKRPDKSGFNIVNADSIEKIKLFTPDFCKKQGWFKSEYEDINAMKEFSNDPDVKNYEVTGEKLMMNFDSSMNKSIENLSQFVDILKQQFI